MIGRTTGVSLVHQNVASIFTMAATSLESTYMKRHPTVDIPHIDCFASSLQEFSKTI
jgi:hypothetical protein